MSSFSVPEPAACRAHRTASAPGLCAARPPRARPAPPRPAPPRPVHCSPRAEAGQAAARRGSERRGGAGSQGPAEESGGPERLPEGRPRVDAAGAGSLEHPAPSLPLGALWLEGKRRQGAGQAARAQAGSVGEEEGVRRAARLGPEVCPDTLALVCPGTALPCSSRTLRRAASPGTKVNIGGCPLSHPLGILRTAGVRILAPDTGGQCYAASGRAPRAKPAEPGLRRAAGSRTISGGHFSPGTQAGSPPCARPEFRSPWREKGCSWQLYICAT
uniref:Uncharacterized protein n=1 Tax=Rangifer tarandus platyrhynchus TaxID=3082113 RepID=A0ACB0DU10_RANTA|nr:unnamed protein product [Rangifer tarandus platyrhynchus]